jgi:hypothetical protein
MKADGRGPIYQTMVSATPLYRLGALYFGPTATRGNDDNRVQTMPGKNYLVFLTERLLRPTGSIWAHRNLLENTRQIGQLNRFHEVVVKTCIDGESPVIIAAVATDGDQNEAPSILIVLLTKTAGQLVAVHYGQADIQYGDLRLECRGPRDCRRSVESDGRNVTHLFKRG